MVAMEELVNRARNGDVQSQKTLLEQCQSLSLPLTYKYLKSGVSVGMNFDDFKQLGLAVFVDALNSYNGLKQTFFGYYKYLYLVGIKGEIRRLSREYKRDSYIQVVDDIDQNYSLQFQSPLYQEAEKQNYEIDKEQIYDEIVNRKLVTMTGKEYTIVKLFFDGLSLKEMSDSIGKDYSETCKTLKRAIAKIKKFYENRRV